MGRPLGIHHQRYCCCFIVAASLLLLPRSKAFSLWMQLVCKGESAKERGDLPCKCWRFAVWAAGLPLLVEIGAWLDFSFIAEKGMPANEPGFHYGGLAG